MIRSRVPYWCFGYRKEVDMTTRDGDAFATPAIGQTQPTREQLLAEIARVRAEVQSCPPDSSPDYVKRLEDRVAQLEARVEDQNDAGQDQGAADQSTG